MSLWVTLLILGGAVLHQHIDGAHASVLLLGYYGIWYLQTGFDLKKNTTGSTLDTAWAGCLFAWFSAFAALLTARFASVAHQTEVQVRWSLGYLCCTFSQSCSLFAQTSIRIAPTKEVGSSSFA